MTCILFCIVDWKLKAKPIKQHSSIQYTKINTNNQNNIFNVELTLMGGEGVNTSDIILQFNHVSAT